MQLWLLLFVPILTVFVAAALAWWRVSATNHRRKMEQLLRDVDPARAAVTTTVLHGAPVHRGNPLGVLAGSSEAAATESRRRKIITVLLALLGMLAGARFEEKLGPAALLIGAAAFVAIAQFILARKKRKRLAAIEDQFPDVLDFLARSVRAGNALSISLEILGTEASEPLRSEFLKVTREMALGASFENALENLMTRVPLIETRFFASAVLLQRETGGNLAEVLSRLATSVRERLRLRGHVRAVSGQGRITAAVLTILPIAVVLLLNVLSPQYIAGLTREPVGRTLLGAAVVSQALGYLFMKKIINIEV
jgi:tight adherence protein B